MTSSLCRHQLFCPSVLVPRLGCVAIRGCCFHPSHERPSSLPTQLTSQITGNCSFSPTPLLAAGILAAVFRYLMQIYANWSVFWHITKHCSHGTGKRKPQGMCWLPGFPSCFQIPPQVRICLNGGTGAGSFLRHDSFATLPSYSVLFNRSYERFLYLCNMVIIIIMIIIIIISITSSVPLYIDVMTSLLYSSENQGLVELQG